MGKIFDSRKEELYTTILKKIQEKTDFSSKQALFDFVIELLSDLPHFDWTGIYEYDAPREILTLYPKYVGLPTDHIQIPKGKGVCGSAVAQEQDIIVKDVRKLDNYLACSTGTRSEIVVLIKKDNRILGQIDVDSDEVGAFNEVDQIYLEKIAQLIAKKIK